ncbi:hypothetical protein C8J56DRAFT_949541 [Mycena floridula]|nr:hypothetical protein C8J56DRAFT_949541 [Mycena floridula]
MDVVSAAAYASGSKKDTGFRGLWRKVKPPGKPDEGVPFKTDDAMFNPPVPSQNQQIDVPTLAIPDANPVPPDSEISVTTNRRESPSRSSPIIPPEEDIRRLFQECKIGQANASLLSRVLVMGKPEDFDDMRQGGRGRVIKEFHAKCVASQELISAQIEWVTAGAMRARASKQLETKQNFTPVESTIEEKLLAALSSANAELQEALRKHEDQRARLQRKVQDPLQSDAPKMVEIEELGDDGHPPLSEKMLGKRKIEIEELSDDDYPQVSEKMVEKRRSSSTDHDPPDRQLSYNWAAPSPESESLSLSSQKDVIFLMLQHEPETEYHPESGPDSSDEEETYGLNLLSPPVHFVYDAMAVRSQRFIEQRRAEQQSLENRVH